MTYILILWIITFLFIGIIIGYFISKTKYKQSGLLILNESKWIIDLHIPQDEVEKRSYILLRVVSYKA